MKSVARDLVLPLVLAVALANLFLGAWTMAGASDDFLPPWVLARLAVTGHGVDTYDLNTQMAVLQDPTLPGYRLDLPNMPQIRGIGLCPYPPTAVAAYAPLGLLTFDVAALVVYFISIALAIVAAVVVSRITAGRVGPLLALVAILCDPTFSQLTIRLGQNGPLTLVLLAAGWLAICRGRDMAAGFWWGVLAYKPQWLFAVAWLPFALRRPRVWPGMTATAALLAAVATAILGPEAWGRWIGQLAQIDHVYATDPEFREFLLPMGCDLRSVSNRFLDPSLGRPLGWTAIAVVIAVTTIWYRRQPDRDPNGPPAASLLFACGLTVPHLYYYDEMVFQLPILTLWSWRAILRRWQLGGLIALTAVFYGDWLVFLLSRWIARPPVWTATVAALWALALTVKSEGPSDGPARLQHAPA
jgi:hypothetical protein